MKRLELVYFNIYQFFLQRNQDFTGFPARLQTMYIVSLSAGGWVLLLQAIFLRFIRHAWFSTQSLAMSFALFVYLGSAMILHRIFIVNNYDEKIYNKYQSAWDQNPNKRRSWLLSFLVAAAPYFLLLLLKKLFPGGHTY